MPTNTSASDNSNLSRPRRQIEQPSARARKVTHVYFNGLCKNNHQKADKTQRMMTLLVYLEGMPYQRTQADGNSNEASLRAAIWALELCRERNKNRVVLHSHNKVAVGWINRAHKCKAAYKSLLAVYDRQAGDFESVEVRFVKHGTMRPKNFG